MKPVYEIKFLGSKDFDNLPVKETNGADISDSLGFYNPFTNRVFIRHTAIPELDKYLLEHEFEHLIEKEPTDVDRHGIRHKKFFKEIFVPAVTGGIVSGGTRGGLINLGRKENKFDPLGIFGPFSGALQGDGSKGSKAPFEAFGGFQAPGFMAGNQVSEPNYGTTVSPFSEQQSSQGGLNQGLNQASVNPLTDGYDPYARYGQQAGRVINF